MSRSQRLLRLLEILRRNKRPVTGTTLAGELGVSLRSIYRDIATLQSHGATIDGEAGLGYVLRPGFVLPPLMFSEEELEAILLGARWVSERTDPQLAKSARNALAKIAAVLPANLRSTLESTTLMMGPPPSDSGGAEFLPDIRGAVRSQHKLIVRYRDGNGEVSERTIWPFAVGFFDVIRVVAAWCELRQDFRHFRLDRFESIVDTGESYPKQWPPLIQVWRERENIPQDDI